MRKTLLALPLILWMNTVANSQEIQDDIQYSPQVQATLEQGCQKYYEILDRVDEWEVIPVDSSVLTDQLNCATAEIETLRLLLKGGRTHIEIQGEPVDIHQTIAGLEAGKTVLEFFVNQHTSIEKQEVAGTSN